MYLAFMQNNRLCCVHIMLDQSPMRCQKKPPVPPF